jgi:hypothetical protein
VDEKDDQERFIKKKDWYKVTHTNPNEYFLFITVMSLGQG